MSDLNLEQGEPRPRPVGGLFISMEGGDGTGKTTQVNLLSETLRERGFHVLTTHEPGGSPLGAEIRQALLHGGDVSPRAEALLFAADRAHHVDTVIRPALEAGHVVITDRYLDSSVAYQGAARSLGRDDVRALSLWAVEGLLPDATILLDVDTAVGAERLGTERDRLEQAGTSFHEATRTTYLELAAADPERITVIDGSQPAGNVASDVLEVVEPLLERLPGGRNYQ